MTIHTHRAKSSSPMSMAMGRSSRSRRDSKRRTFEHVTPETPHFRACDARSAAFSGTRGAVRRTDGEPPSPSPSAMTFARDGDELSPPAPRSPRQAALRVWALLFYEGGDRDGDLLFLL